jgi:MYXO-CTERM domain-containing protein
VSAKSRRPALISRALRIGGVLAAAWLALAPVGCGAPPGSGPVVAGPAAADGALTGELAVYVSDDPVNGSETSAFLRDARGTETRLLFGAPGVPDLAPGSALRVSGVREGDALRVTSFTQLPPSPPAGEVTTALVTGTPFAARSFAFVLVDLGEGINTDATTVMGRLVNDPDSIRNYYVDDSYGMQDITAQVFGPLPYSLAGCATSDTTTLANTLRAMIPGTFQHYLWYFGSRAAACTWSGLASVGTPDRPSRDTWYNASTNCTVLVQEPGHNFGMQHSSSLSCPDGAYADDPNTCTASEYGDIFDPMGDGCRHMNAWQKAYQGWFGGCNGVKVTDSGTFNLVPFEQACDGVQFLQIAAPKSRTFNRAAAGGGPATTETFAYYYLELRTPIDFDGTLGNTRALTPMVLVHVGNDLRNRNQTGLHTFLLDMTPSTAGRNAFSDAALPVGQTFTDPAGGVSFTVQSAGASGATINVTFSAGSGAAPTCLDGTAFTPPGPGAESCGNATPTGAGGIGGATAGTGGQAGGVAGASASPGQAGTSGTPTGPGAAAPGGCACAIASPSRSGGLLGLGLLAALFLARRRRVRR